MYGDDYLSGCQFPKTQPTQQTQPTQETDHVRGSRGTDFNEKGWFGPRSSSVADGDQTFTSFGDAEFSKEIDDMNARSNQGVRTENGSVNLEDVYNIQKDKGALEIEQKEIDSDINNAKKSGDKDREIELKQQKKELENQLKLSSKALSTFKKSIGIEKVFIYEGVDGNQVSNKIEADLPDFRRLNTNNQDNINKRLQEFGIKNNNNEWKPTEDGTTLTRVGTNGQNEYIAIGVSNGKTTLVHSQWKDKPEGGQTMTSTVMQKLSTDIKEDEFQTITSGISTEINRDLPGEEQSKIASKYTSLDDFNKDVEAGKFEGLSDTTLESLRNNINDRQIRSYMLDSNGYGNDTDYNKTRELAQNLRQMEMDNGKNGKNILDKYSNIIKYNPEQQEAVNKGQVPRLTEEQINQLPKEDKEKLLAQYKLNDDLYNLNQKIYQRTQSRT